MVHLQFIIPVNSRVFQLFPHPGHKHLDLLFTPAKNLTERPQCERIRTVEQLLKIVDADLLHVRVPWPMTPRKFDEPMLDIDKPNILEPPLKLGAGGML